MMSKKGFTLIEMLIVVAIIGILAGSVLVGLGPVQKQGRDGRRVSDLKNVQNGLELYYSKNQSYPTGLAAWADLQAALTGAGIGIQNVPVDPNTSGGKTYYYASVGPTYVVGAVLEDATDNARNSSFKGASPGGEAPAFPGACGADVAGGFFYCVTL